MSESHIDLERTNVVEAYIDLDRAELLEILADLHQRSIERSTTPRYAESPVQQA